MPTLILGASGATGRLLADQLLSGGESVRLVVRSADRLPDRIRDHASASITEASVLDLSDAEMKSLASGCEAVALCLGHNLTFKGIFGQPRMLVTDATRRFCEAIKANDPTKPVKVVLMNTTGNRNRDLEEPISFAQKCVLSLLRCLVPPHRDNERAAEYLRAHIGQDDPHIEWAAVRPDSLTPEDTITAYDVHASPTRSAIFDAGKTSRINVAAFMVELITDGPSWGTWKGRMPVIYNRL